MVARVHGPSHSSNPLECSCMAACAQLHANTLTHYYLEFSGQAAYMGTHSLTNTLRDLAYF